MEEGGDTTDEIHQKTQLDYQRPLTADAFIKACRHCIPNSNSIFGSSPSGLPLLHFLVVEGGTRRKFDSGYAPGPDNIPIYAFTQCTPDLSKQECEDCLQRAIEDLPNCCGFGQVGGRVLKPSCNFRYENKSFLGVIPGM
ncbi:hypothetical protein RHGRI_025891 [Rhododendron griersonianum]|uniref:Gnk2-homologous domain-containing protein n=1 Tax=Rhododendron griersonianum TaxID=479676 RepID=A0AAV6IVW3_9ERIC|nr:hypothetical protein RHGRI_025891 [Rhododendron griersonianum]